MRIINHYNCDLTEEESTKRVLTMSANQQLVLTTMSTNQQLVLTMSTNQKRVFTWDQTVSGVSRRTVDRGLFVPVLPQPATIAAWSAYMLSRNIRNWLYKARDARL